LIKLYRNQKGYTQEQVAALLGITLRHYQNIEYGKTIPNYLLGYRLCLILDIEPGLLATSYNTDSSDIKL
jgi:putative transcriptional regulator